MEHSVSTHTSSGIWNRFPLHNIFKTQQTLTNPQPQDNVNLLMIFHFLHDWISSSQNTIKTLWWLVKYTFSLKKKGLQKVLLAVWSDWISCFYSFTNNTKIRKRFRKHFFSCQRVQNVLAKCSPNAFSFKSPHFHYLEVKLLQLHMTNQILQAEAKPRIV